jgi:hypothetical protein
MNFQQIVLYMAIILLIVALIVFGSMLYTDAKVYPPTQAQCPDYWIDMSGGIGTGGYCINTKNLGKGGCSNRMNFNTGVWTGDDSLCNKQKWAKGCDLTWDGVTNNPNACGDDNDEDGEDLLASSTDDSNNSEGFGGWM